MLADFLGQRGYTVACLNGSRDLDARREVQRRFAGDAQVLVSTDAGGEGIKFLRISAAVYTTLTSVSRQAIFAADPPFYFASSIGYTKKEERHWSRFWEDRGLKKSEVAYLCQREHELDEALIERVREEAERPKCRALAIVIGTVDEMLHGAVTGSDGLHASVRHWAQRGSLMKLVDPLLDAGFEVALTADHGNVHGRGIGKLDVGVTAEVRGERVQVYRGELTRSRVGESHPGCIAWPNIGLPEEYLPLLAPARRLFITEDRWALAHGGACIEEVVVPFVRIGWLP